MTDLDKLTEKIQAAVKKVGGFEKSLKLDLGKTGSVFIHGLEVSNQDDTADCTLHLSADNLVKLGKRELDPVMAFMSGIIKISGDINVAITSSESPAKYP